MVTTRLGVNIDHVATLRQVRLGREPEPVAAALLAQSAGAQSIMVHLRADRRHIQDRDARLLRDVLSVPLNVVCAATPDGLEAVVSIKPNGVTLVPEPRDELTPQGGLDAVFLQAPLRQMIRELHTSDIRVSLFIDPHPDQVKMAYRLEADGVEFNTGTYANLPAGADTAPELERLRESSKQASRFGLAVAAGRGLNLLNAGAVAALPDVEIVNMGHSIVARALQIGMERAVTEVMGILRGARA